MAVVCEVYIIFINIELLQCTFNKINIVKTKLFKALKCLNVLINYIVI